MTIDEVLCQTARQMGFPEEILKRASDYAKTGAGVGPGVEAKMNRELSAEEVVFYSKYAAEIIRFCREVPGFREVWLKVHGAPPIDN
jgi:hypothetical protein